jgi:hypothetical protein
MAKFTVSEIAERIRRPKQDRRALMLRLRNWTKEGFLSPSGDGNPGTGRKRLYPESALIEALVLNFLTDAIGMQTVKGEAMKEYIKDLRSPLWNDLLNLAKAQKEKDGAVLLIGRSADRADINVNKTYLTKVDEVIKRSDHDVHIVIDLKRMFSPLISYREKGLS